MSFVAFSRYFFSRFLQQGVLSRFSYFRNIFNNPMYIGAFRKIGVIKNYFKLILNLRDYNVTSQRCITFLNSFHKRVWLLLCVYLEIRFKVIGGSWKFGDTYLVHSLSPCEWLHESSKVFVEHARHVVRIWFSKYGFEPRPNNHARQRARLSASVYQSTDTRTRIKLMTGKNKID